MSEKSPRVFSEMRDLESRERKAPEEMLGKAERAWCYPGCRIPIWAKADLQSSRNPADQKGPKARNDLQGSLETCGGRGGCRALL